MFTTVRGSQCFLLERYETLRESGVGTGMINGMIMTIIILGTLL